MTAKPIDQSVLHWLIFSCLVLLQACVSIPDNQQRQHTAELLAQQSGWHKIVLKTTVFDLVSYVPDHKSDGSTLTVYIEGDGLAWLTTRQPSTDPTPINPVGLKLALADASSNVAYLARPCQYLIDKQCETKYWTSHRFSSNVIYASNQAIDELKQQFSAQQLVLVGYSGGGAVATLLAARRNDVIKLITVAGNLDHKAWTDFHKITPLTGSLNPADYRAQLAQVEQVHFVGEKDTVIPPFLAYDFVAGIPTPNHADVIKVAKQTHNCCWDTNWNRLNQ